jgi:hypothetical protein
LDPGRSWIEDHRVGLDLRRADRLDVRPDGREGTVSLAQQVQISCRPVGLSGPQPEEHGALEHETILDARDTEPVEEALEAEAHEKSLVVVAGLLGSVQETRGHRGGEVARTLLHAIASR